MEKKTFLALTSFLALALLMALVLAGCTQVHRGPHPEYPPARIHGVQGKTVPHWQGQMPPPEPCWRTQKDGGARLER